ncbi:MAG: cobalamin transport system substrate-binding protein, partial [Archaeoglobi archaeon]|nr:cobalamin transport system substrate-binding protein [Archaeoglobi archaeon]
MRRELITLLLILTLLTSLSGCSEERSSSDNSLIIVDALNRTVSIERTPERIVSLAPSVTEILFAVGAGEKVVGVTYYCDYPEEARERPKVGDITHPDIERILSLSPDLVIAHRLNDIGVIQRLDELGIPVIALDEKSLEDVMRSIELIGKITGCEENATKIVENMREKIREINESVQKRGLRVMVVVWHDPVWIAGGETFIDDIIKICGGLNVFEDVRGYQIVGYEKIIERDPQIIIVMGDDETGEIPYEAIVK